MKVIRAQAVICFLWIASSAWAADPTAPTTYRVEMTDGVYLATDVYLPESKEPAPAILLRTPYGRSGARGLAENFLKGGYAVVSQDIRGRGDSEGENFVIFQSGGWAPPADGHATLRWIAEQPWSNGKVATMGGSALGITQNMLAPDAPDALKAQYVEVATSNLYYDCMYQGGAFRRSMIEGWLMGLGITKGNLDAFHAHPAYDEFWETFHPGKFAERANAPAIYVGGWYDIFAQGTIESFLATQTRGGPAARGKCRLIIGPWAHGPFEDLKYPKECNNRPIAVEPIRYFNHFVKGEDNGVEQDMAVHYWVMGDPEVKDAPGNEWRSCASWPPPSAATPAYFHADGMLSFTKPEGSESKSYRYDPRNPVPTIGGQELILPKGPKDQRSIESREDVLVFSTEVLKEPIEVTGRLLATLYVASDCPDTDFTVKLSDVYPDGRSMLVSDGILRARYHKSFSEPELLEPGRIYEITVDVASTSLIFNKGHRIRVAVSSSNNPRFDANPNTGKHSWEEKNPRVATNTIHLSADRPSHITLPVVK